MDEGNRSSPCKEYDDGVEGAQSHLEVQHLHQHIAERDVHFVALEAEFLKCSSQAKDLEEQVVSWKEKYERLHDSHKRLQMLNQVLEDKLLQIVEKMKSEKTELTKDIATLSVRVAESKHNYSILQKENERYKNDMNLAITLLQCKPDNFVSHKLDNLPLDTQARVSQYVMSKAMKPTGSNQSKNGNDNETFDTSEYEFNISASLMAKILEDSVQETVTKHCDTCTCNSTKNKPFCYNENFYTVGTQTALSEEVSTLCFDCNNKKENNANEQKISTLESGLVSEKTKVTPLNSVYIIPQPSTEIKQEITNDGKSENETDLVNEETKKHLPHPSIPSVKQEEKIQGAIDNYSEDIPQITMINALNTEPSVHHKLCDRTKISPSSKKSSTHSAVNEDLLNASNNKEIKYATEEPRKNSHSSMGALSRTSSLAKSTISTHKSHTHVGPGPRFCHLRLQAGSKNILLDNAEPDVPPVLYKRLSKCENSMFKELNDETDNFIDFDKSDVEGNTEVKADNVVVESTLIDVQEDNGNKDAGASVKSNSINPILLNVSSSPLQPLKTHSFSNGSEHLNNNTQSIASLQNTSEVDNLLNDFHNVKTVQVHNNSINSIKEENNKNGTDNTEVKIFNFDRYEQSKLNAQYIKPLRKIDMSQLHALENTKISKDFPPHGDFPKLEKHDILHKTFPAVVNVYPNLTQTQLKVSENKKVFTYEQSTSSLSSGDSAAVLQKQQLLRVAEWVEKNLEQQNNLNDPLEDEVNYTNRMLRRENKLSRLTETLNELALNMPHPVSKYSKYNRDNHNNWIRDTAGSASRNSKPQHLKVDSPKETVFPADVNGDVTEITNDNDQHVNNNCVQDEASREDLKSINESELSKEDLARMEYNVKQFLLSGAQWAGADGRTRRTSSKTETDV